MHSQSHTCIQFQQFANISFRAAIQCSCTQCTLYFHFTTLTRFHNFLHSCYSCCWSCTCAQPTCGLRAPPLTLRCWWWR